MRQDKTYHMKKLHFILVVMLVAGFVSCQNTEQKPGEKKESRTESQQADITDAVEENQPEEMAKPISSKNLYHSGEISEGDLILGLTVTSVDVKAESYFKISFEGDIIMKGHVQENPMEYTTDFYPEESPVSIDVDGVEYDLFEALQITNADALKSTFTNDEKTLLNDGLLVPVELKLRNPSCVLNFGNKGRLGFGEAEAILE